MLPLILLSHIAVSFAINFPECDLDKIDITNGFYSVTDGGNVGSTVEYTCPEGTQPFPADSRECLPNGHWTDEKLKAQCEEVNSYHGVKVETGGLTNIFIILDASSSVGARNFHKAKEMSKVFIEKMDSFDFVPRYAVISHASFAKPIVQLADDDSADAEAVIEKIQQSEYSDHDFQWRKNTRAALREVHKMLSLEHIRNATKFLETRNIILLITDGKYNVGGDPTVEIERIRELLNIRKDNHREDFLDIYVFGLGDDISVNQINDIASKKSNERHVFNMRNIDDMKKAFDHMFEESQILQMCGLSREPLEDDDYDRRQEQFPWIAKISITRSGSEEKCKGSLVSRDFILTAAHCFYLDDQIHRINVRIGDTTFKVKNLYRHPKYNPLGKGDKKVKKSFDYDLALIQLDKKVEFSRNIRPLCLPCTSGTSWALKQNDKSVKCIDHVKTLLPSELEKAMFVSEERNRNLERKDVTIKRGNERLACLDDTKKIDKYKDIPDIKDLITDNFLCTGGTEPVVDPQTCKGDGGGPLIVQYKQRFIQVGVISWGTIISCDGTTRQKGPVPQLSRDFHTNLANMLDWLKEKMPELEFLD